MTGYSTASELAKENGSIAWCLAILGGLNQEQDQKKLWGGIATDSYLRTIKDRVLSLNTMQCAHVMSIAIVIVGHKPTCRL